MVLQNRKILKVLGRPWSNKQGSGNQKGGLHLPVIPENVTIDVSMCLVRWKGIVLQHTLSIVYIRSLWRWIFWTRPAHFNILHLCWEEACTTKDRFGCPCASNDHVATFYVQGTWKSQSNKMRIPKPSLRKNKKFAPNTGPTRSYRSNKQVIETCLSKAHEAWEEDYSGSFTNLEKTTRDVGRIFLIGVPVELHHFTSPNVSIH